MPYIDRDKLKSMTVKKNSTWDCITDSQGRGLSEIIDSIPTADVVEVKHGTWIHDGYDFPHGNDWIHCSVCGKKGINVPADLTNFCPNCGAKMDGEETEDASGT